jgi:hypothetical protein
MLRKVWNLTRNLACKRQLIRLPGPSGKLPIVRHTNCEISSQALWSIVKSLMKKEGPKAPTIEHGPLGITYCPNKKVIVVADWLENQFTSHDLFDENHEQRV